MVTSAPQHLLPWRPPLVCWSQSQMLLSIFLSRPLLQCCLREACLIWWCLSVALSYQAPSHCTPLLGQVPLVAGTAHLSTPASVPPGPPPGTSSIFFQPALLFPLFQISQFLLLVFFTAGQFSLLTISEHHNSWFLLPLGLSSGRISGSLTTVSPSPSLGRCSSGLK